jgi:hypothetical protein
MQTQVRRKTIFLIMTCMYVHMYEHMYVHMYAHMYHNPEYIPLDLHFAHELQQAYPQIYMATGRI